MLQEFWACIRQQRVVWSFFFGTLPTVRDAQSQGEIDTELRVFAADNHFRVITFCVRLTGMWGK